MQALSAIETARDTRTDARARMAVSLLASVMTIVISSFEGQAVLFAASLCYVLSIRRYGAVLIAYAVMALMMALATLCTYGLSRLNPAMPFTFAAIAVPFMRGLVMMNVVLPLALTCRIQELLTALKGLKLPFCIYIPAAVMIRFIPTFMNDVKQVAETLKIRGYELSFGQFCLHPLLMLRLMFTPLLFRSLRTSEELGMAAELKGLDSQSIFVPCRKNGWKAKDTLLVCCAVCTAALALYGHLRFGTVPQTGMH